MATGKADLTVRGGGFDVGEKIGLSERHGDFYLPGSPTQATATVSRDGEATFKDQPFGTYWVHRLDEPYRALTFHHKARPQAPSKPDQATVDRRLAATRAPSGQARMVTGAVGTGSVAVGRQGVEFAGSRVDLTGFRAPGDFLAHESDRDKAAERFDVNDIVRGSPVGHETPKDLRDPNEATPRLAQEDARNVPQRSATITGEAHPADPDEPLPHPRQDQVARNQPQRSATELGEAAPIPAAEASPGPRQEDARDLPQRSATQTGEAAVKPATREPETTRVKESSEQKAVGHAPQGVASPAVSEESPAVPVATEHGLKTPKEAEQIEKGRAPLDAKPQRAKAKPRKSEGVKTKPKDAQADDVDKVRPQRRGKK